MRKILLTGYNGFVGKHCVDNLVSHGYEIIGITKKLPASSNPLVSEEIECDLSDPASVDKLELPDVQGVINLAGIASNTSSNSELVQNVNIGVHVNLYRHIARIGLNPRIIAVSSGAVYEPNQLMPETEESLIKNSDTARPYELSKIKMEEALREFEDLDIIITRPFNHIGPGQEEGFIVPDLSEGIYQAIKDKQLGVSVGNLSSSRDYTDVRDVAEAYTRLFELINPKYGVYNVCSGKSYSGEYIFNELVRAFGADEQLQPIVDSLKLRGISDNSKIFGSNNRIKAETGWVPIIEIETTIKDYVNWFIEKKG